MVSKLEEIRDKYLACRQIGISANLSYEETELLFQKLAETYNSLERILIGFATMDSQGVEHKKAVLNAIQGAIINLRE